MWRQRRSCRCSAPDRSHDVRSCGSSSGAGDTNARQGSKGESHPTTGSKGTVLCLGAFYPLCLILRRADGQRTQCSVGHHHVICRCRVLQRRAAIQAFWRSTWHLSVKLPCMPTAWRHCCWYAEHTACMLAGLLAVLAVGDLAAVQRQFYESSDNSMSPSSGRRSAVGRGMLLVQP